MGNNVSCSAGMLPFAVITTIGSIKAASAAGPDCLNLVDVYKRIFAISYVDCECIKAVVISWALIY